MLFLGGMAVGILLSAIIAVVGIIIWKKLLKKKLDDVMLRASLKAMEKEKNR